MGSELGGAMRLVSEELAVCRWLWRRGAILKLTVRCPGIGICLLLLGGNTTDIRNYN